MPQDVNPIIDRWVEIFPACFSRSAPKPLKIGLGEELMALAGVHPALADLTRTRIRRALNVYTGAPAYRRALVKGGFRYDLDGQPAGEVTPEQQTLARTPRARKPATAAAESIAPPTCAAAPAGIPLTELLPARRRDHYGVLLGRRTPGFLAWRSPLTPAGLCSPADR